MRAFRRRTYTGGPAGFLEDVRFVIGNLSLIKRAMRGGEISFRFRERLMMVVTEVNGCRYCSYYHSSQSIKAGLSSDELRVLLAGQIPVDWPPEEIPALVYARHWAQSNARPDFEAVHSLVERYGDEKAALIHSLLRLIRAANLLGNTLDYFLYRISFGWLGLTVKDNFTGSHLRTMRKP
ncbi:MAG: carboxymuconolactone decarboxylase family protein [Spirochaetia bacterium]|jgi:AhpD family alkylhydroperoxidase